MQHKPKILSLEYKYVCVHEYKGFLYKVYIIYFFVAFAFVIR